MDPENSGCISTEQLFEHYDVSSNSDFMAGRLTKEQIFQSFVDGLSFDGKAVSQVRKCQEWCFYHRDLSLSIVDDEYFVRMCEAIWGVQESATATVKRTDLETITATIRRKMLDLSTSTQSAEFVMRAVYREFDRQNSGVMTSEQLQAMLLKLQVAVEQRYLDALLARFDRRGDGCIEFEEFISYLVESPYK